MIKTGPREIGFVLWGHCQNLLDDPRINGNIKHKICTEKRLNTSQKDLCLALTNHGRHGLFSFLVLAYLSFT